MSKKRRVGIWMDHSSAHVTDLQADILKTTIMESGFTHEDKEATITSGGEKTMHNKEQQHHAGYYKRISEVIKGYEEVLLFGPTDAKSELHNLLKEDHHFDTIKIEVKSSSKMPENQQHAFVREHFKAASNQ